MFPPPSCTRQGEDLVAFGARAYQDLLTKYLPEASVNMSAELMEEDAFDETRSTSSRASSRGSLARPRTAGQVPLSASMGIVPTVPRAMDSQVASGESAVVPTTSQQRAQRAVEQQRLRLQDRREADIEQCAQVRSEESLMDPKLNS